MKKSIFLFIIIFVFFASILAHSRTSENKSSLRQRIEVIEQRLDNISMRLNSIEEKIFYKKEAKQKNKTDLEIEIEGMLARGTIYDINLEFNQIRSNYDSWNKLDLLQKNALILMFSDYMFLKTKNRGVLLLNGNSPNKLAEYNPEISNKIKIYD